VKQSGRRVQTPYFNVVSCPSTHPVARVGIIVGRRLGGAVLRNRAKRIFREVARHSAGRLRPGRDVLIFPRREALAIPHAELRSEWTATLRRAGLIQEP
jgi:ribonuclease P protein component